MTDSRVVDLPVRHPRDTLGRPLHDLRISVMDRCNFRCPYCMPRETFHEHYRFLKSTERLSFEDVYAKRLEVMDRTAITLCQENHLPIVVFDMGVRGNLARCLRGEPVGTTVGEPRPVGDLKA